MPWNMRINDERLYDRSLIEGSLGLVEFYTMAVGTVIGSTNSSVVSCPMIRRKRSKTTGVF
jgi:hypothetical protein